MNRTARRWPDEAFKAIADPTRREILRLLRTRDVCSAGEIAACFSKLSRPAISRHLRVLRQVGLVIAEDVGREHRFRLSHGTLARVHHEWFRQLEDVWHDALSTLKQRVESPRPQRASRSRKRLSA